MSLVCISVSNKLTHFFDSSSTAKAANGEFCLRPSALGLTPQKMKHTKAPRTPYSANANAFRRDATTVEQAPISCFDPTYVPSSSTGREKLSQSASSVEAAAMHTLLQFSSEPKMPMLPQPNTLAPAASPVATSPVITRSVLPPPQSPSNNLPLLGSFELPPPPPSPSYTPRSNPLHAFASVSLAHPPPGINFSIPSLDIPTSGSNTMLPAFKYSEDRSTKLVLPTLEPEITQKSALSATSSVSSVSALLSSSNNNNNSATSSFPDWFFDERTRIISHTASSSMSPPNRTQTW